MVKLADGTSATGILNLPAALIVLLLTGLLMLGTRESARVNNVMVAFKLFVVGIVIVVGAFYVNRANWVPFIPANTGTFGEFGWSGILRGSSVVFFAYIGFDAVSTAAQEARRPQQDMPVGILGSLIICTILYVLMALVMTGMVPYQSLGVADPVAVAIDVTGIGWLTVAGEIRRPCRADDGDLRPAVRPGAHPVLDGTGPAAADFLQHGASAVPDAVRQPGADRRRRWR